MVVKDIREEKFTFVKKRRPRGKKVSLLLQRQKMSTKDPNFEVELVLLAGVHFPFFLPMAGSQ